MCPLSLPVLSMSPSPSSPPSPPHVSSQSSQSPLLSAWVVSSVAVSSLCLQRQRPRLFVAVVVAIETDLAAEREAANAGEHVGGILGR